ncbi:hypothetical protein FOXG_21612 [Fusarium oxysporum f. sp. lycopersici 4287]|uniref:Uncharacterized protein n=2 Tax=Fusarium oxysporum TaxID=5507 RepID=A0A0J9VZS5_FUSO4|nr:hypothetical protein FOXG_21612 [Fusarium oxysporum f. sp. lycopersici 4287]EXK35781.1 hypothetical protein FOMG_08984 [Fusarium oxysporum f. sp. melonis 26406]KNB16276.1 hypothetical protein FOXG_21612 [Fusarium oxysporum f. sp. lycopersici 4287]
MAPLRWEKKLLRFRPKSSRVAMASRSANLVNWNKEDRRLWLMEKDIVYWKPGDAQVDMDEMPL